MDEAPLVHEIWIDVLSEIVASKHPSGLFGAREFDETVNIQILLIKKKTWQRKAPKEDSPKAINHSSSFLLLLDHFRCIKLLWSAFRQKKALRIDKSTQTFNINAKLSYHRQSSLKRNNKASVL